MQRMLKYSNMRIAIAVDKVAYYVYYYQNDEVVVTVYLDNRMDFRMTLTKKEFQNFEEQFFLCEGSEQEL